MAKGRSSKVGYYSVVQMGRECGQMTMDPNVGKQKRYNGGAMCRTRKGEEGLNKRCTQSNLKKDTWNAENRKRSQESNAGQRSTSPKSQTDKVHGRRDKGPNIYLDV